MTLIASDRAPSVYFHVPFCAHKCEYCAFYSHAPDSALVNRYVAALVREMEMVAERARPRTLFFGGGTPSLLTLRQWETILQALARAGWETPAEWTVECNPATVSLDKARLLRDYGVNRISMGAQSLDEALLERLGRIHSRAAVFKSYDLLRRAGFENVNLDFMFAIPGQSLEAWRQTLTEAFAMQPEHLSCYEVIYEEDTPLYFQLAAGQFRPDEELAALMYDHLLERAGAAGFRQYEIANFARDNSGGELPDRACQHNVNYWRGGNYLGLGPSAAEFWQGVRTKNWPNTVLYCERLEAGRRAIEQRDELSPEARAGEIAAFGLRMNAGWPFDLFRNITGIDLRERWPAELRELADGGFAEMDGVRFRLTGKGLRFADWAAEHFLAEPARSAPHDAAA